MSLRGLEMLLALTGCLLLFGLFSGNLTVFDLLWAGGGIGAVLTITAGVMRTLFPYLKETRRWERFTERVGSSLTLHSRGGVQRPSVWGRVADCHVTIAPVDREHLIVVSVPASPSSLEHHEINLELRDEHNRDQPSLPLGDPEFDAHVVLRGSVPEVVAVLDVDTRAMALELMRELSVEVRRRQVLKYGRHLEVDPEGTWLCLQRMAELADRLFRLGPRQARRKLAFNAERDPNPKVRALNLRLLFEYYPPDPQSLELGRAALSDDDLACVLAGAIGLADSGMPFDKARAFTHLFDVAAADTFSDDLRSTAIDALALHFPDQSRPLFHQLAVETGPLPSALLSALRQIGSDPDLDRLLPRALIADEDTQLAIALRTEEERIAVALLASPYDLVKVQSAKVLVQVGTVGAVEPLLPLTRGLLRSRELREMAQSAIRSIQARANGDGGQLSISRAVAGELSEVD